MTLKRNHQKVSKWKYFELATFSKQNKATVRWVFGRIDPNPATVTPEQAAASQYPGSAALYAWIPIHCDR
jgi:hypothetical protein